MVTDKVYNIDRHIEKLKRFLHLKSGYILHDTGISSFTIRDYNKLLNNGYLTIAYKGKYFRLNTLPTMSGKLKSTFIITEPEEIQW